MKKVLALVLAVIMVCTMAMAATIDVGSKLVVTGGTNLAKITLDPTKDIDFTETYYLQVPADYFNLLSALKPTGKYNADVFTVSGLNGGYDATNKDEYYVPVKVADKPLDGNADLVLGVFTIKYDANNFATFKIVNNEFVLDKLVIGSMDKTATATAITNKLNAQYDIGYEAKDLYTSSAYIDMTNETKGWFFNNTAKAAVLKLNTGITLTVPAKTYFYFEKVAGDAATLSSAALGLTNYFSAGYTVSAGTIEYKLEVADGSNHLFYAVDKNGNVYNAGLTFVIEKDTAGHEHGYWTLKTTDYPYGLADGSKVLNVGAIPGASTGTNTNGTTTNPGTGANDVVGVAAALAVVALVSGAAISLKK